MPWHAQNYPSLFYYSHGHLFLSNRPLYFGFYLAFGSLIKIQSYSKGKKAGSFFYGKKLLPVTTDNISSSFPDEIDETEKLTDSTYSLVVGSTFHTQQNLSQNKQLAIPHLNCSFMDAFNNHIKSCAKYFLMWEAGIIK